MAPSIAYCPLVAENKMSSSGSDSDRDQDESALLYDGEIESRRFFPRYYRAYLPSWLTHLLSGLLTGLFTFLLLKAPSNGSCYDRFNAPSPIASAMRSVPFIDTQYVYSLWAPSPYKGPPDPSVNAAWNALLSLGTIAASPTAVAMTGQLPNASSVLFPPSVGSPAAGRHVAVAGGAHHLHCLHYIWQDHYLSHFPEQEKTKAAVPEMYERHYEHCIDYLRQGLMCNFDTGIIPYNWVRDNPQPTPNGNTWHRCVNWAVLEETLMEMAVEMPEGFHWSQPEGVVSLRQNP